MQKKNTALLNHHKNNLIKSAKFMLGELIFTSSLIWFISSKSQEFLEQLLKETYERKISFRIIRNNFDKLHDLRTRSSSQGSESDGSGHSGNSCDSTQDLFSIHFGSYDIDFEPVSYTFKGAATGEFAKQQVKTLSDLLSLCKFIDWSEFKDQLQYILPLLNIRTLIHPSGAFIKDSIVNAIQTRENTDDMFVLINGFCRAHYNAFVTEALMGIILRLLVETHLSKVFYSGGDLSLEYVQGWMGSDALAYHQINNKINNILSMYKVKLKL
eukprot:253956_1